MIFNEIPNLTEEDKARFTANVDVRGLDECWLWQAATDRKYGIITIAGKGYKAHRVSYFVYKGLKPDVEKDVCHQCDNPPCVNPHHLFEGTRQENLLDCSAKGRAIRNPKYGDNNPVCKLSDAKVELLRQVFTTGIYSTHELAAYFGIARSLAYRIVAGKSRNDGEKIVTPNKKEANKLKLYLQHYHGEQYCELTKNNQALKNAGYVKHNCGYTLFIGFGQTFYKSLVDIRRAFNVTTEEVETYALNWLTKIAQL